MDAENVVKGRKELRECDEHFVEIGWLTFFAFVIFCLRELILDKKL